MGGIIVAIIVGAIGVASYFYTGKADNPVEQVAERIMETELGLPKDSIDLTPDKK